MDKKIVSNKKIFITGGTGFIGSSIVDRLVDNNEIIIYDNFNKNYIKNTELSKHPNVTIIHGDVLDYESLHKAIVDFQCEIIIHLAAILGVETVISDPVSTIETNLIGAINILKISRDLNSLERFINFSTSEVYGTYSYKMHEKESTMVGPSGEARWLYALSKLATDHLALSYYKKYSIPATSIRPFNIYGPRRGEAALYRFIDWSLNNKDIIIHGDGDQIRSWCYIDDFVDAIELCLLNDNSVGEIFNIGNPKCTTTILSLAELVIRLADSKSKIKFIDKPYEDIELRIPSIERAKVSLGYNPKIDLSTGIQNTIEWYKSNQKSISIDPSRDLVAKEKY